MGTRLPSNNLSDVERRILRFLKNRRDIKLREYIDIIMEREGLSFRRACRTVYRLWKKGYIDLDPLSVPSAFHDYARSPESVWFWILTVIVVVTVLTVFYVTTPPRLYLRYVLGSIFVLYVPGATLIEALYPRGVELEPLERFALSIGLSLAIVPLVGLVLNYTPWGIRLTPVAVSLALLSETLALVALYRKYKYYILEHTALPA